MAITHVSSEGVLGPSELAHRIDVTTGAVTALVDRLAERGHLERQPHPADRRKLLLTVTPHALDEVLRHVLPLADDVRALAKTFNDEERTPRIGRFLEELIVDHRTTRRRGTRGRESDLDDRASTDDQGGSRRDINVRYDHHVRS